MATVSSSISSLRTSMSLLVRLREPSDAAAWSRFAHLYTPLLYSWSRRTGLQEQDAADLVQDVFVRLLRELPQFQHDPAFRFRTWLKTVTMNLWRDRNKRGRTPDLVGDNPLREAAGANDIESLIDREYSQRLTERALQIMQADFNPETWRAFSLMVVDGRPADEVARELGLSVGAVHARKFRVLARLRQELDGLGD